MAYAILQAAMAGAAAQPSKQRPLAPAPTQTPKLALVPFDTSPFPYRGDLPDKSKPFFDVVDGDRLGHTSRSGAVYWEDQTYSDRRVLLYIPRGFDARRPALVVVFFHGNEATLTRDVRNRQGIPRQVAESGLNAVLVAPQFAVNALDSSAGRFWEAGVFAQFLTEAADRLSKLHGDERSLGAFRTAPVVIAAYSGGYQPAAFTLLHGRADDRLRGVLLFDAPYAEFEKFADWIAKRPPAFFVSAFGRAARDQNAVLQRMLHERAVRFQNRLAARLNLGSVIFIDVKVDVKHEDFMTDAWVKDPLKLLLRRIDGFSRTGGVPPASKKK
jgi:hypothetical protein